jgi:hypothetical protein
MSLQTILTKRRKNDAMRTKQTGSDRNQAGHGSEEYDAE